MRQFYGRPEKCVLSAGKTMSIKFRVLGGGILGFFGGGGGSADFIFMGARIFLTDVRPPDSWTPQMQILCVIVSGLTVYLRVSSSEQSGASAGSRPGPPLRVCRRCTVLCIACSHLRAMLCALHRVPTPLNIWAHRRVQIQDASGRACKPYFATLGAWSKSLAAQREIPPISRNTLSR